MKNDIHGVPELLQRREQRLFGCDNGPFVQLISFSNKSQARAVLDSSRPRFSSEDMYTTFPAISTYVEVRYLIEESGQIVAEAEETAWITEEKKCFSVRPTTLGHILKQAAAIVTDDDRAWDPYWTEDEHRKITSTSAKANEYLKSVAPKGDGDDGPGAIGSDFKKQTIEFTRRDLNRTLILRTWPWSTDVASTAVRAEMEWLQHQDDQ
jgi:hypothetical protein